MAQIGPIPHRGRQALGIDSVFVADFLSGRQRDRSRLRGRNKFKQSRNRGTIYSKGKIGEQIEFSVDSGYSDVSHNFSSMKLWESLAFGQTSPLRLGSGANILLKPVVR